MDTTYKDRALQLDSFFLPSRGADALQPSTHWLEEPEFPTAATLTSNTEPQLLWIPSTELKSKERYLEKQYRMQRYEAIEPTRRAVAEFRTRPDMSEGDLAHIYVNVQTQGIVLTAHGAATRVSFSTERVLESPIDWASSNRLCQGTLVVLSPMEDAFRRNTLVATVAYRFLSGGLWPDSEADVPEPDDTPPRVDLYFSDWNSSLMNPNIKYYMLEAKTSYFEPYRHTMLALQAAANTRSQLDRFLLAPFTETDTEMRTPPSILRTSTMQILDPSQVAACQSIIDEELAIVQGPPGTGKTFTTVTTIDEIIRQFNPKKPIIVAAQSNHALDQLLERCLSQKLSICRLGGRTTSRIVEDHTLFNVQQIERGKGKDAGLGIGGAAYKSFENSLQAMELDLRKCSQRQHDDVKSFRNANIITPEQCDSLQNGDWEESAETDPLLAWLGWDSFDTNQTRDPKEQVKSAAAIRVKPWSKQKPDTEDKDRVRVDPDKPIGPFIRFNKSCQSSPLNRLKSLLARHKDLYKVKPQHREELFKYMCQELARQREAKLAHSFSKFKTACERLQQQKRDRDCRVIFKSKTQVLGCTITGLSKYRRLLSLIGPDVLIVDEASEATEGSIAAAFIPSIKHLALIGDHQQLSPRPNTRILTNPVFAMDVSLFERLVKIGMTYQMLNVQRRMIPEIREIVSTFYPRLTDHPSVLDRERVQGVDSCLWWFDHTWPEQAHSGTSGHSFSNHTEADMIVGFVKYLIRCGTPVDRVTILTFYTGQQELIQSKLGLHGLGSNICKTVDSFQGCENDVVILSIVRSPNYGGKRQTGFVENIQRATVALSRARNGFFSFGNAENLKGSTAWATVLGKLQHSTMDGLPLICPLHGTKWIVRSPEDWSEISGEDGCCGKLCGGIAETQQASPTAKPEIEKLTAGRPELKGPGLKGSELKRPGLKGPELKLLMSNQRPESKEPTKLMKSAADMIESTVMFAGRNDTVKGDGMSSNGGSQDSSAQGSDYMMEIGYDAFLAEFDEMVVNAREAMPSDFPLIDLTDD